MSLCGVGPKVADCILLFSLGRFDVFPTDVWVKRVMAEQFACAEKDACKKGSEMFGDYAGIAQQYLFYERREKFLFFHKSFSYLHITNLGSHKWKSRKHKFKNTYAIKHHHTT